MATKKSLLIKILLFSGFLSIGLSSQCQVKILGKILDNKDKSISQANILLYSDFNGDFLGFGVSQQDGSFSIEINSGPDSVVLQIEHLSFESVFFKKAINEQLKIILNERSTELPEVIITPDRVKRMGDTIIYDIAQFKNGNDNNLEDILRKLPGISIEANGAILYNNEIISHFFIEGLDMLGGRYKVASRGLDIDAVSEIHILENHQHIKALKDIVKPTNAAINIKLKSGITYTGNYEGGIGATPFLYNAKGNIFGFNKNFQFNILGASNNIGLNNKDLFQSITNLATPQSGNVTLNVTQAIQPRLRSENYRLNNEHTLGLNFLKKLKNDFEIKYNASAHQDRIRNFGGNNIYLFDNGNPIKVSESINTQNNQRGMDHTIHLESNKNKLYFVATLMAEMLPTKTEGDLLLNNNPVKELLSRSLANGNLDISTIIRRGVKAYRILSTIEYESHNDSLTILPTSFTLPGTGIVSIEKASQFAGQRIIRSHTYTSFHSKKNNFKYDGYIGIKSKFIWLKSSLTGIDSDLDKFFTNDVYNGWSSLYCNQDLTFDLDPWHFKLMIPFSLQSFKITDSENNPTPHRNHPFVYQPTISLAFSPNFKYTTSFSAGYSNFTDNQQNYFDRYILSSNRNVIRRLPQLYQSRGWNFSSSHNFTNIFGVDDRLFIALNWNTGVQNQIVNNDFDQRSIISAVINKENTFQGFGINGMFKSEFFSRKAVFDLNYSLQQNTVDQFLNGILSRTRTSFLNINTSINFNFTDRFAIKGNVSYIGFGSNIANSSNTFNYGSQVYTNLYKNLDLRLNLDIAQNSTILQNSINSVIGAELSYRWSPKKFIFTLQVLNLTNNRKYQIIQQSSFQLQESFFQLRPRQIFLSIKKII